MTGNERRAGCGPAGGRAASTLVLLLAVLLVAALAGCKGEKAREPAMEGAPRAEAPAEERAAGQADEARKASDAADASAEDEGADGAIRAPEFTIATFDGGEFSLSSALGSPVVINFWGSWCGPCRLEAPFFQEAYEEYGKKGVVFVGVAIQDRAESARAFVEQYGWTFPVGLDVNDRILRAYSVYGVPKTVIVDRAGFVSYVHTGLIPPETLSSEIEKLL